MACDGVNYGSWGQYNSMYNCTLTSTDGNKTVKVMVRDAAGNVSAEGSDNIVLDKTPPVLSTVAGCGKTVCINANAAYTNNNVVTVSLNVSDNYTAKANLMVMLSEDAGFAGANWQVYADNIQYTLSGGDGTKTVYVRVRDLAGNMSGGADNDDIILDRTAPSNVSVVINGNAEYTNSVNVTLTLNASGANQMMISNSSDFSGGVWESYGTTKSWVLASGSDGVRSVYVKYRDNAMNESVSVFDTIILDTSVPVLGSFVINGNAIYTNSVNVVIGINVSGATEMRIACDGVNYSAWVGYNSSYNCTLPVGDGVKTVRGEFRDMAGNVLTGVNDTITLDTTPPTNPTIQITGYRKDPVTGNDITDVNVTYKTDSVLTLSATGATMVAVSNDSVMDCATATYFTVTFTGSPPTATISGYQLNGGTGTKTVYACFKDDAGNYTSRVSDTIDLDQSSPYGLSFSISGGATYTTSGTVNLTSISVTDNRDSAANMFIKLSNCADFGSGGCNTTAWISPVPSTYNNWNLTSGEGQKYVFAKVRDYAGNESTTAYDDIFYDSGNPIAYYLTINNDAVYTTSLTVNLQMSAYDSGSGLSDVKIYNNSDCSGSPAATQPYSTSISSWNLAAGGNGGRSVCVKFVDKAGRESAAITDSIVYDNTAPTGCIISLGGGVSNPTNTRTIGLNISATDANSFVDRMMISESSTFSGAQWENYATSKVWTLSSGDGSKTIYVKFRDGAGNENTSSCASVNITLDTTAPTGSFNINNGAEYSTSSTVTLTNITASDNLGGPVQMMISNCFDFGVSGCNTTNWINLATSYSWSLISGDGTRFVYMKFRDNALNESSVITRSIVVDSSAPGTPTVLINNGDEYTSGEMVTLTISAGDALSGVKDMYISRNGLFNDGTWETYSPTKTWDINGSGSNISEVRSVYVRVRDVAGNVSGTGMDDIKVDFDNPVLSSIVINSGNPETTTSTGVQIHFTASDVFPGQIRQMMISEDSAFAGATWLSYVNPAAYTLSSVNGTKTVYAKLRDGSGRESVIRNDSIILDNRPPTPLSIVVLDSSCINPIQYTNSTNVCVKLTAEDNIFVGSDLKVAFGNVELLNCSSATYNRDFSGCSFSPCTKNFDNLTIPSGNGLKYISACVSDKAGNNSNFSISSLVYLDTLNPTPPANIDVVSKSRSAVVNWTASYDGETGVKNYVVEYSGDGGSTWTATNVGSDTTTYNISGLVNGRLYSFRVKAVDYAGNSSSYITKNNVLIGMARANVHPPIYKSTEISFPIVSYINGDLFLTGRGREINTNNPTVELYKCEINRKDCRIDSNWKKLSYPISGVWAITDYNKLISDGFYYYVPLVYSNNRVDILRCNANSDCMNQSNWTLSTIDSSTSSIRTSSYPLITDGKKLYYAYFVGNTPRISSCALSTDCTNAANWVKVDITDIPGSATNDASISLATTDSRIWIAYFGPPSGGNTPLYIGYCDSYTQCDIRAEWTIYTLFNSDSNRDLDLISSGKNLFLSWRNSIGGTHYLKFAKCLTSTGCDTQTDWVIGNALDNTTNNIPLSPRISYSNNDVHIAATDGVFNAYYMRCNNPDVTNCDSPSEWIFSFLGEVTELANSQSIVAFDSNVVIAIDAPLLEYVRLLLPSLVTPVKAVVAPSIGAFNYSWDWIEYVDGYENMYDKDLIGGVWDNKIFISDPMINRGSVSVNDNDFYYSSLISVRGIEKSSDASIFTLKRFEQASNIGSTSYVSSEIFYSSFSANNTLYISYIRGDNLYYRSCPLTSDCTRSVNWISEVLVNNSDPAGKRYPQVVVSSTHAYISYHDSSSKLWVSICALSTGCDASGEWSHINVSSSGLYPSAAISDNRIAIAANDSNGYLRFHYCNISSNCLVITNWTRDVFIHSTDSSTSAVPSLGYNAGAFYVTKKINNNFKKYYCLYSDGCESTTDWSSMTLITTSSSNEIYDFGNAVGRDSSYNDQYITATVKGGLRVGICTGTNPGCNNISNWAFIYIQDIDNPYLADVDIFIRGRNIYLVYVVSGNYINIARCNLNMTNCFNRDNWKIGLIQRSNSIDVASKNLSNLVVVPDGSGNEYIYYTYSRSLNINYIFRGLMNPQW
ncbi:MAG: fibronectin type III domain-containing protein [Deltaproteobacteria bacterium]|nr:fibronectin type III domain-containing protein [Deltaproteobacteria bacterium]